MSPADNLSKQFGPRGLYRPDLDHSDGIPERIFRKKLILKKNQQTTKVHEKFPRVQRVNLFCSDRFFRTY